ARERRMVEVSSYSYHSACLRGARPRESEDSRTVRDDGQDRTALRQCARERIEEPPCRQRNQDDRKAKRQPDVLANDAARGVGQANELWQASQIGAEQSHVRA